MKKGLLDGKKAVITGGVRGIGLAIAERFAAEGADLLLTTTRDIDTSRDIIDGLRSHGGRVELLKLDVSDRKSVEELLPEAIEAMGGVDVLVNNAGIVRNNLMIRMSEDDWDDVIRVDLKSAFNTCQATLPFMLRQKSGSVINISSVVGIKGNPGQCNYAAAKAGVIGMTCSLAKEMGAKGIRANCIAPGFISTEMTADMPQAIVDDWIHRIAMKRAGQPEEVAGVALFLASELSSYVNAQVINCCGGING